MIQGKVKIVSLDQSIIRKLNEAVDDPIDRGSITSTLGGIKNFKDCDVVYGPDGTEYDPKFICGVVEDAVDIINMINEGVIKDFLASLPFVYTFQVPTMATDGKHIFMNPGFILYLLDLCDSSPIGVAFVIIHEVYHNLFKHAEREAADPGRFTDHRKANMAQDYEINWVIEHSYPDRRSEAEAQEEGESVVDENGQRVQLFKGITETCKGLIDDKFRNTLWEDIYDQLDNVPDDENEEEDNDIVVDYSDDYKRGMKDGMEDALRILRSRGLVESVSISLQTLMTNRTIIALCESKTILVDGTYDDGYKEGYDRIMKLIDGLINGGSGGGGGPQGPRAKEVKIPGLPTVKPKFDVNNDRSNSQQSSGPQNPPVELPKQSSQPGQGGEGGDSSQNGQQGQQGQQGGQGGQGGQQGQQGGQGGQGGQQGQQGGQGGQQGGQGGQQGGQGGQGGQQGSHTGTGTSDISKNAATTQGEQGTGGSMSNSQAKQAMNAVKDSGEASIGGKAKVIGISNGGYSGKSGASGNHVITEDEGRKLAQEAGHNDGSDADNFAGRENPFNDKNRIRDALKGLKKSSIVLGSNGTPGCGLFDNIDDVLVSLYEPTINWKRMLKRYMKGALTKMTDIGYSKKGIVYGRYNRIKDREGETAKRILICIDTSESVVSSGDYLRHIIANVADIVCRLGIRNINVIQFSDGVYKDTAFNARNIPPASEFALQANKKGGTSFMPVFKYIKEEFTDKHKSFQAVIFFTDDDVFGSKLPSPGELSYENRIIWFILSAIEKKLPYGKRIIIGPDEFKKQLYDTDFISADDESEIYNTNETFTQKFMNKRIYKVNEAVFGKYKDIAAKRQAAAAVVTPSASTDNTSTDDSIPVRTPAPAATPKKLSIMAKRKLAIDAMRATGASQGVLAANKMEVFGKISKWFKKYLGNIRFYQSEDKIDSWYLRPGSTQQLAWLTDFNTVEVKGDVKVVGAGMLSEWPDELVFERINGNFHIGMNNTITQLPHGLPMTVTGNYIVTNIKRLTDLNGSPIFVGGNTIVSACPNLKSLFGAPKKCKYFYSDIFSEEEYDEYLITTANESRRLNFSSKHLLNEAFKSNLLSKLANNPANREALNAMKSINIMWSEIPDEIVNPIYNNVAKSLAKRRDDNSSGEYGIYIWCDANNKINIIGTGNNKNEWSGGQGWLYISNDVMGTINDRIKLVRNACRGDVQSVNICEQLGLKYDNKNISQISSKGGINGKYDITFTHLLLLPDMCCRAYLIQGTKDAKTTYADNKIAHFSYVNSHNERSRLQRGRAEKIKGILVQGRNLNVNDPAYKKYFDHFVTDAKLLDKFINVKSLFDARSILNTMAKSMEVNATKVRQAIFKAGNDGILVDDQIDAIYSLFTAAYIRTFRKHTANMLNFYNGVIDNKKYNDPDFTGKPYADTLELSIYSNEPASYSSSLTSDYERDLKNSSYDVRAYMSPDEKASLKWFIIYTKTVSIFASIMSAISNARKGDYSVINDLITTLN